MQQLLLQFDRHLTYPEILIREIDENYAAFKNHTVVLPIVNRRLMNRLLRLERQ